MDVSTLIVTSLLMLIAITIWQRWRTSKDRKCLETIPGPKPYPLIGNAQDFRTTEELISVYIRYMKNYGDLMKFWIGSTLKILISDPNVSEALLTSTKNITKDSGYRFLHSWLGEGLLTSGPTRWRKHRKILTPAFHFQILEKFVATFENATTVFIQKLRKHKDIRNLDIYPLVDLCSLDIICETSMGTAVDAQENEESEYVTAVSEMTRIMCEKMISPMKQIHFLYRFTKDYQSEKAALKILHDQTHFVIKQRKNEILKMQENSVAVEEEFYKKPKMNFLDILLLSKIDGEPLSDEAIREEVDTFMFEGHDTTASAMSFAFFCLANHPEVQQSAVKEQIELFGNQKDPEIQHNDLQNMKYLELVIKETLRLYPSVPNFGRSLTEDMVVDGQLIPKGVDCFINAFGMHRNPKYYNDPETFNPMRFTENDNKLPFVYVPFSAGSRNCIGQKFAMLEMKYVISSVLRHFILEPATPKEEPILCHDLVLKSKNGIKVGIRERI